MDFLVIIFTLVYAYAGDQANYYLKYHILGVRAEIYSNTGDYTLDRFIWAVILGWATIPIAILHYVVIQSKKEQPREDTSLLSWKNPEIRERIDWFLNPKIFGEFRIDGLTAGEIIEAHELALKFLNYEAGKETGESKEKLSLVEEQRLLTLMNKAKLRE